ncbi:mevalonate kinase [Nicoliella spurrieriana]|uniref:Mevalonate kinase n=1 Tax=Nicoliella spurrieriana TaxID=2925830 RepID=A0A976RRQ5_9LACO|nr:mevalonate kinase [Nicoliella spurrieriana]UQS86614.1 mevalonate kinase [Nicoliella spurrieriana]
MKKEAIGKSHAKIILIGEHSVVYGHPAIAFPIDSIPMTVTISTITNGIRINSEFYKGSLKEAPVNLLGIKRLIEAVCKKLATGPVNIQINFTSEIPSERGMGSSAAVSIALIKSLYNYFEAPLTKQEMFELSTIEETITHGNPSGIDTATVSSEAPVWFIHKQAPGPIKMNLDGYLIIADSGIRGQTDVAVNSVRQMVNQDQNARAAIGNLGQLTTETKATLEKNDLNHLGTLLNHAQQQLDYLGINIPRTEHLIQVANRSGSLGSKLTGSGLGGCIIALADNHASALKIANALENAGAVNTWIETL